MARRSPSAASRSSSGARAAGPRVRSDGKVDIYCPQCGAHYRIAEQSLESKVTCTECTRTFFAKTVVGKRPRQQDNTKVYVGLGFGVLVVVVGLIVLSKSGTRPAAPPPIVNTGPTQLDLDRQYRRDQVRKWATRVAAGDLVGIQMLSDMAALQQALGVPADLAGSARDAAVLEAMKTHDAMRLLLEMDGANANADVPVDAAQTPAGTAEVILLAKPGDDAFDAKFNAVLGVDFRMDGTQLRVTGASVKARPKRLKPRAEDAAKYFVPSKDIAKPEEKEILHGGQTIKIRESPAVALPHEAGTAPELQQKIDKLVADVIRSADPETPGALFGRSCNELEKIGKPAIARLLNAMHDLYGDVNGNNLKLSQIDRCLLQLTGMQFAYDVRGTGDAQKDKAARESSIRQWFAWWWRFANSTHTDAIDKSEELLDPVDKNKKPAGGK